MHGLLVRTLTNTLLHPSVHTLMSHSKQDVCTLLFMASQRYVAVTSQRHAAVAYLNLQASVDSARCGLNAD